MRARTARMSDAAAVHRVIAHYAGEGLLLPRTEAEIRELMSGNICRCGAYPNIVRAIQDVQAGRV